MTVLLLGSRVKYQPIVVQLVQSSIDFVIYDAEKGLPNQCKELESYTTFVGYENFFEPDFYKQKHTHIDKIINLRDQATWIKLEQDLCEVFDTKQRFDNTTRDFFGSKAKQDQICKQLDIPTLGNSKNKIIVKKDQGVSGGTDFYITSKSDYKPDKNDFVQDWAEIDRVFSVQFYADYNNNWHLLSTMCGIYEDNCPVTFNTPVDIRKDILYYMKQLKTKINTTGRIMFWQFIKPVDDDCIYNMDFNCRPAGGFENGSYDFDVSDCNWSNILLTDNVPTHINYHSSIQIDYNIKQTFGYSSYQRTKKQLQKKQEVIVI